MSIATATLSSKYQISIPKEVRDSLNLKPGQKLAFLCIGKSVKLVPQTRIEDLFGIGKDADPAGYRDRDTRREDSLPKLRNNIILPRRPKSRQKTTKAAA